MPKIACVVVGLPEDFEATGYAVLKSLDRQTVPIDVIAVLNERVEGETTAIRVSKVLNRFLKDFHIENFDYLLRVDADVWLPSNFLEANLVGEPDLVGQAGFAMIIKVKPFLDAMGGRFHPFSDDSYTAHKLRFEGYKLQDHKVAPILLRKAGRSPKTFISRGEQMYRLGYEPIHVLLSFLWVQKNLLAIIGYVRAFLRRLSRYDVAPFVQRYQVHRLLHLTKNRRRSPSFEGA